jgi:glycosyltransferase involved in cell wall biosynthesis
MRAESDGNSVERRPIRVLHVASGDLWAGAEAMLWYLVSAQLGSARVEPSVVLLNDGELAARLRRLGLTPVVVDERRHSAAGVLRRLHSLMREVRPDLVHTHRPKENVLGGLAARSAGIVSLRTIHGTEEHPARLLQPRKWTAQKLNALAASTLQAHIVAVSCALADRLPASLASKTSVIHNGIAARAVNGGGEKASAPAGAATRVGFVGRLTPIKRVDRFLAIGRRLADERPGRFELVVAGDGPLLDWTRRHVEDLGLSSSTRVLGFVDDIGGILRTLNALYVTSDDEGIPYCILEAHALGVLVIASAVGGLPEVLQGGAAGVLVAPEDLDGFVRAGIQAAEQPAHFAPMVCRGKELVQGEFSSETMARRYAALYSRTMQTG